MRAGAYSLLRRKIQKRIVLSLIRAPGIYQTRLLWAARASRNRLQRRDNRRFAASAALKIKAVGFDRFFRKVMIGPDKLHIHAAIRASGLTNDSSNVHSEATCTPDPGWGCTG